MEISLQKEECSTSRPPPRQDIIQQHLR